jgi:hypothetical protein
MGRWFVHSLLSKVYLIDMIALHIVNKMMSNVGFLGACEVEN